MRSSYPVATKPKTRFVVLIVEPSASFQPTNWRNRPLSFRVIAALKFTTLGNADARRFLFNEVAKEQGSIGQRWAVVG